VPGSNAELAGVGSWPAYAPAAGPGLDRPDFPEWERPSFPEPATSTSSPLRSDAAFQVAWRRVPSSHRHEGQRAQDSVQLVIVEEVGIEAAGLPYDALGRVTSRTSAGIASTFQWDTATNGIGALHWVDRAGIRETYTYDSAGRKSQTRYAVGDSADFVESVVERDGFGRPTLVQLPARPGAGSLQLKYGYDDRTSRVARVDRITAAGTTLVWRLNATHVSGALKEEEFGNGLKTVWGVDPNRLLVDSITTGVGGNIQNLAIGYDAAGNVDTRTDRNRARLLRAAGRRRASLRQRAAGLLAARPRPGRSVRSAGSESARLRAQSSDGPGGPDRSRRATGQPRRVRSDRARAGGCSANAVAESFFATIEGEMLAQETFETRAEATAAIADYVDELYNVHWLHSSIGYLHSIKF
jgi:Integrase core domain